MLLDWWEVIQPRIAYGLADLNCVDLGRQQPVTISHRSPALARHQVIFNGCDQFRIELTRYKGRPSIAFEAFDRCVTLLTWLARLQCERIDLATLGGIYRTNVGSQYGRMVWMQAGNGLKLVNQLIKVSGLGDIVGLQRNLVKVS